MSSLNDSGTQERGSLGVKIQKVSRGNAHAHGPVPLEFPHLTLIRA